MKIGTLDGSISFGLGSISRSLNRHDFLATELGSRAESRLVSEKWWHFRIEPEDGIAGFVIFEGDRLHQVLILIKMQSDSADKWTVENELVRKTIHDEWLLRELGKPPYHYRWGDVASEYDEKGCVSDIVVTYAN